MEEEKRKENKEEDRKENRKENQGKTIKRIVLAGILAAVALMGAAALLHWAKAPYLMRIDCRGMGIDVERMKQWEEAQKDNRLGIRRLAGWRVEEKEEILAVSTGRKESALVMGVYGAMELVGDERICSGRYGLEAEGNFCVISEGLARALFGGTDCCGEWVKAGKEKVWVAGVIKKEEPVLLRAVIEGEVEMVGVELEGRLKGRERAKGLMGE